MSGNKDGEWVSIELLEDGEWVNLELFGLPGHKVQFMPDFTDPKRPQIVGLKVELLDDGVPVPVTRQNLVALRAAAYAWTRNASVPPILETRRRGPKARTTTAEVANLYEKAREEGRHPRKYAAELLGLSLRTIDQYASRAREEGLIAPTRHNQYELAQVPTKKWKATG